MKKTRIWELDFLRGFAIIMMIFDHLMYDFRNMNSIFRNFNQLDLGFFNTLNDIARWYWSSDLRFVGHMFFVALFLLISGISYTFSKSNLSRGLKLVVVAVLISVVTYAIEEITKLNVFILFGVIHMFGFSILLTYLVRKIWNNDWFVLAMGSFIIGLGIINQFWELNYISFVTISDMPEIIIGTKSYGADTFGLVPYAGVIMVGTVIGNQFYKHRVTLIPNVKVSEKNIVNWVGRNSLVIFLTHQFVLFGLILLIGYLFGYRM